MKNKTVTLSIVIVVIIILGILFTSIFRLNSNLLYKAHKQIDISIGKEFENEDILNIIKEVTENRQVVVQKLEVYEDMVSISIEDISDEELESLNTKINEKYELENTLANSVKVTKIPQVEFIDYIKEYIMPTIVACVIVLIYLAIYILIKKRADAN